MKELLIILAIVSAFVYLTAPVSATHRQSLSVGKIYTDTITVCNNNENLMNFIEELKQIADSADEMLRNYGCTIKTITFQVEKYICGFYFHAGRGPSFSVIKIFNSDHYAIFHITMHQAYHIECTTKRINNFSIKIPN